LSRRLYLEDHVNDRACRRIDLQRRGLVVRRVNALGAFFGFVFGALGVVDADLSRRDGWSAYGVRRERLVEGNSAFRFLGVPFAKGKPLRGGPRLLTSQGTPFGQSDAVLWMSLKDRSPVLQK
jgi:hypothetical protein